ncbi:hypothetical protein Bca52824_011322 [Brassica carinata]|uniref:Uncharacterized protein n=1 Tax=Brassica carinata TaxID=52824 RepID=A0A8X7WF52_BRACI|nr:hypothetical protein Bca52824_011322 [Brassica carinata]
MPKRSSWTVTRRKGGNLAVWCPFGQLFATVHPGKRKREEGRPNQVGGGGDRIPTRSWSVGSGDRLMMGTRGKEKDLEKGLSTPERTPKEAAGASGHVGADDVHLAAALPIQTDVVNAGTGLSTIQLNPTEVRVDGADVRLEHEPEQADGPGGTGRLQQVELEDEGESSHAGRLGFMYSRS